MKKLSAILAMFVPVILSVNTAYVDVPADQVEKVNHLLNFVKNSGCIINRNGTDHPAGKGVSHINKKYDYFRDDISSTEEFIEYSATKRP